MLFQKAVHCAEAQTVSGVTTLWEGLISNPRQSLLYDISSRYNCVRFFHKLGLFLIIFAGTLYLYRLRCLRYAAFLHIRWFTAFCSYGPLCYWRRNSWPWTSSQQSRWGGFRGIEQTSAGQQRTWWVFVRRKSANQRSTSSASRKGLRSPQDSYSRFKISWEWGYEQTQLRHKPRQPERKPGVSVWRIRQLWALSYRSIWTHQQHSCMWLRCIKR